MAQPINPTTPPKPATAGAPAAPPTPPVLPDEEDDEDDDLIPDGADELKAKGVVPVSGEDRLAAAMDRMAEKINPNVVDRAAVRATKRQPQGVAPAVPMVGHAIITDEFRTFRRMIPTAHIMHPTGNVVEVGESARTIPTGLSYEHIKSGAWKVECFSPHPDELLTVGEGERARKFNPSYPFDVKKYIERDGVLWHPIFAPKPKK